MSQNTKSNGLPPAGSKSGLVTASAKSNTNYNTSKPIAPLPVEEVSVKKDNGNLLVVAFLLMLFFQLGNRIFGKLQTYPMYNYPFFVNMISTFVYVPICFAYIIPIVRYTKIISKEQLEIPKMKFCVMGVLDGIAGIMQTFSVNYIANAPMIVLVQQSAIPISMAISRIFLNARYTIAQYTGASIVLLGIVAVLIPNFSASPKSPGSPASTESLSEIFWVLVLMLSCIPMCLSSVYKEKALGEADVDVIYLNGWVSVFQFLFSLPLCFPSASVINLPYNQIISNLWSGLLCWCGINTITEYDGIHQLDDCSTAPIFMSSFLFFNIIYNILIIIVLKHGSANILWMASTVIVPLSNVIFSLDFMPGHRQLKLWDLIGLGIIMFGLVVYRFTAQIRSLYHHLLDKITAEELEQEEEARIIGMNAERKQTNFLGLNQIDSLQTFVDIRVQKEKKQLMFRSTQQIRGSLLLRLGIPPSPFVSINTSASAKGRYQQLQRSPNPSSRVSQRLSGAQLNSLSHMNGSNQA